MPCEVTKKAADSVKVVDESVIRLGIAYKEPLTFAS